MTTRKEALEALDKLEGLFKKIDSVSAWQTTRSACAQAIRTFIEGQGVDEGRLDIHILLGVMGQAARGKGIEPDMCETIRNIAEQYSYPDTDEDIQALYDCGDTPQAHIDVEGLVEEMKKPLGLGGVGIEEPEFSKRKAYNSGLEEMAMRLHEFIGTKED